MDAFISAVLIMLIYLTGAATMYFAVEDDLDNGNVLIEQCEQSLPRDQHCELYAKPVKEV